MFTDHNDRGEYEMHYRRFCGSKGMGQMRHVDVGRALVLGIFELK